VHFYFLNSSGQHWPILIILSLQNQKKLEYLTQMIVLLTTSL